MYRFLLTPRWLGLALVTVVLAGAMVAATEGDGRVGAAVVLGADGARTRLEADLVAVSGGWNPVTQLHRAIGGGLRYAADRSCFVPDGGPALRSRWASLSTKHHQPIIPTFEDSRAVVRTTR